MKRSIICAAAAAAAISFAVPAQAMTANATLNLSAPATIQLARYSHHYRRYGHYRRNWWHSYAYTPYRHCWTVRTWHGWVRRCS